MKCSWKNLTRRIQHFFSTWPNLSFQHDLTLLFNMTHRNWNLLFNIKQIEPIFSVTQRIFSFNKISDSNNLILFFWKYQRIELLFLHDSKNWIFFNMTQRIEFFTTWLKELNLFFFSKTQKNESMNWNFLSMTQRIEPFFKNDP